MSKAKCVSAAVLCLSMALIAGCGDKKIDGSSDESLRTSSKAIFESLPDDKKSKFGMLLVQGRALGIHGKNQTFAQALDGKTADEVIEYIQHGIEEKTTLKW